MNRKLLISLLSFAALFSLSLNAQPRLNSPEIYFGVQGGAMASFMNFSPIVAGTDNLTKTALLGTNGGLLFRYIGHKYCGLQVEMNYMQRGWREQWQTDSLSGKFSRQLDYIEIPFLMHLYFGSNNHRGFINLGPQVGYCIRDLSKGDKHPTSQHQYGKIDNPFDWGIAAAAGYYARTQKCGAFQLELRFNYSLGSTFSHRITAYFSQSAAMNLSMNVAYLWEMNKHK